MKEEVVIFGSKAFTRFGSNDEVSIFVETPSYFYFLFFASSRVFNLNDNKNRGNPPSTQ